ncbi:uncharacterized protein BJ171DRAFT_516585 [Polychytrium aggregatum]|uniref:uncharacterized protein n=1 Tax=Polychytrium aggregatum TaxID=110093 RepID=UPI0022FEFB35|nr:uncharacterized protein BJ171DRAFT_516585 [Polychytrium aggregatum]KAI9201805.1 hypothetical protein BJ171DRAFT_516585 [Polychytrium aggregatum]
MADHCAPASNPLRMLSAHLDQAGSSSQKNQRPPHSYPVAGPSSQSPFAHPGQLALRPVPLARPDAELLHNQKLVDEFYESTSPLKGPLFGTPLRSAQRPSPVHSLGQQLEQMNLGQMAHAAVAAPDFTAEFLAQKAGGIPLESPHHPMFESAFRRAQVTTELPTQWTQEFQASQDGLPPMSALAENHSALFEAAFEDAKKTNVGSWTDEFSTLQGGSAESWADEFQAQQPVVVSGDTPKEQLKNVAGLITDIVASSNNAKMKNSKFFAFMEQIRDEKVVIENNTVTAVTEPRGAAGTWADQFVAAPTQSQATASTWASEFRVEMGTDPSATALESPHAAADKWIGQFDQPPVQRSRWEEEFTSLQVQHDGDNDGDWIEDFTETHLPPTKALDHAEMLRDFEAFKQSDQGQTALGSTSTDSRDDWVAQFETENRDLQEKIMSVLNSQGAHFHARYDNYEFSPNNPYLSQSPEALSRALEGLSNQNLIDKILIYEAIVQQSNEPSSVWLQLGLAQQENENDVAAISALRKSLQTGSAASGAWIDLAVSYTNESLRDRAIQSLESWLSNQPEYQSVHQRFKDSTAPTPVARLTEMFIEAARCRPFDLDPNVQVALGVLFHISGEWQKATECFEAALSKRPRDYLLWNKLGATLANAGDTTRALEAYTTALEINPCCIRTRYNIGISCMQLEYYKEAAGHFLAALSIQNEGLSQVYQKLGAPLSADPNGLVGYGTSLNPIHDMQSLKSRNLWDTLRTVVESFMRRPDLGTACANEDLDAFRKEFEF